MKKNIYLLFLLIPLFSFSQTANEKKISVGAHWVHRNLQSYKNINYPRLGIEYRFTKCSSVEFLAEYINLRESHDVDLLSYPLSLGYKLNILPWFTKNEWLVNNLRIYNSLRYTLILTNQEGNTTHHLRYAPGIDCYVYKNLALSGEIVFGEAMKTTLAFGVKLRF